MYQAQFRIPFEQIDYSVSTDLVQRLDGEDWGKTIIGQPRALEALDMGIHIRAKGYNVFCSGVPGTGRKTAILQTLSNYKPDDLKLKDYAYVYNYKNPLMPEILILPAGKAQLLKKQIHSLVESIKKLLSMQNENSEYAVKKEGLIKNLQNADAKKLTEFEEHLEAQGFQIVQIQGEDGTSTTDIFPIINGKATSFEDASNMVEKHQLPQETYEKLENEYSIHIEELRKVFIEIKHNHALLQEKLAQLQRTILSPLIHDEIESVKSVIKSPELDAWLVSLEEDILNHLYLFLQDEEDSATAREARKSRLRRYGVNIIVDNSTTKSVPIIIESHPTFTNLFGTIESTSPNEKHAYLNIRAGSLLRANGGFLIIQAEDILKEEESWITLKRVLSTGSLEIQPAPSPFGNIQLINPKPIPIDVKVILISGEMLYDLLYNADPDFQKLFKITAEFDDTMQFTDEAVAEYIAFIRKIIRDEKLCPITYDGIAAVIEYGRRLSEHRQRLSTRFSRIADLLREAEYRSVKAGKVFIDSESIDDALRARDWLADLPEEKLAEMIIAGEILLQVQGNAIGRVNGLAVHDRGYYSFGLPAVISAQVSPGESGVINIEGESGLSGEIYDKAVLIVEGFLRSRYARNFPLAVSASICFEQSYAVIEGDSASSTAVYALLSAIAQIPLRQDIAVTGSVNQMGQVQPVGGINEKIEGFFQICKRSGLSGTQGVMIPRQNIINLTLSSEVMRAIKEEKFHIYAVATIDEGLELLSGVHAGTLDRNGAFEPGSFNDRVFKELKRMADTIKEYLS